MGGIDYGGLVGVTSGYDVGANMIRWSGTLKTVGDRLDLYHEAGHGFDHQLMTPLDRERVRRLIDPSNDHPWFWPEGSDPGNKAWQPFEERFADVYARLAAGSKGYPELRGFLQMIAARSRR